MQTKYGKHYADWTDERGARRRKAFKSKKQALAYQKRMRFKSAAKKALPSGRSRSSSTHGHTTPKTASASE